MSTLCEELLPFTRRADEPTGEDVEAVFERAREVTRDKLDSVFLSHLDNLARALGHRKEVAIFELADQSGPILICDLPRRDRVGRTAWRFAVTKKVLGALKKHAGEGSLQ